MAYADQQAAILTHAIATGAAMSPVVKDVAVGLPFPRGRCIRVYWDGEQEPVRMGTQRVLNAELVSDRVTVTLFLPISTASEAQHAATITQMYAFKHDFRTRILADSQLGGMSTDLELEYMAPDLAFFSGWFAVVTCTLILDYVEYPIAP